MEINGNGIAASVLFSTKPECTQRFCDKLAMFVEDTARAPGFRDIEIVRSDQTLGQVLIFEHWDDLASFEKYVAWRTDRGDMGPMIEMLTQPPVTHIWSEQVARKTLATR